jgi:hypothetical protein
MEQRRLGTTELGPVAGLPVATLDPLDAMGDLEGPGVPVESRPAQAEYLAAAHPVRQRQDDDQLEAVTSCRTQQNAGPVRR